MLTESLDWLDNGRSEQVSTDFVLAEENPEDAVSDRLGDHRKLVARRYVSQGKIPRGHCKTV